MKIFSQKHILIPAGIVLFASTIISFTANDIGLFKTEAAEPFEIESCGVERWSVKVYTDADAANINLVPVNTTIADLVSLKTPTPNANMPRQDVEKQAYAVHCTVKEIKLESDGDYHLLMEDSVGHTMIGEIADPTCPSTMSSLYIGDITRCRKFIDKNYHVTTSFQTVNKRFIITGVGFVDPPHGQSDAAPNNLEIHSILDIQFEPTNTHNNGIADNAAEERQLTVYPNPFGSETQFRLGISDQLLPVNTVLQVFDISGKEIRTSAWPAQEPRMVLKRDGLKAGIYFYNLVADEAVLATGKIMAE